MRAAWEVWFVLGGGAVGLGFMAFVTYQLVKGWWRS